MKHRIICWMLPVAFLWLSGCGFHLRGVKGLPESLQNVAIINQGAHPDLAEGLKKQFKHYHVRVNPEPATAAYWLILLKDTFKQDIFSISSSTTPRQYELFYTVRYKLQNPRGKALIPENQLIVARQFTSNADRILGSDYEEAQIKKEMRRDAVIQMLYKLAHH